MKMTFRWFGKGFDKLSLAHIRQIPGLSGIVGTLLDIPVGEAWPLAAIRSLKCDVEAAGLELEVIESVNVHEDIKLGLPSRDRFIENYILTLRNLGKAGVKVVCYNFMPVFDWTRTELSRVLDDGSTTLSYEARVIDGVDPRQFVDAIEKNSNGFSLPGWEPKRLAELSRLFEAYQGMDSEALWANLAYFLEAVVPEAEKAGIKMGIHPDDPPWPIFGLPRIITNEASLERLVGLVNSPANGISLCSGSLGADPRNDIPFLVRRFGAMGRIPFGHVRNVARGEGGDFYETAHLSVAGSLDIFEIMRAYHDIGYEGYIRPDHGRMIWSEEGRPGYGLYDRALGLSYLNGLWEALEKTRSGGSR